ncbi:DUF5691 domain-containing protein [Rhodococcus chondri]|uniref:DUF5691 domain-containing protein n=1 Tax=Rhodococcus chondri TaxID=3065941 RepID=A0ABU7JXT0_9NOCA|nr:DUF5691 domain-containing protein [Rhodococcus sp. CC-R104]MEE2034820.1 DUF5691 domain-containing protein [Rhodococcus sp. CC-R104]
MTGTGLASLTTAALLGTARSAPDLGSLYTGTAARSLTGDPAQVLLGAAALESVFVTGGAIPAPSMPPAPAPDDDRPELPAAAVDRLQGMLVVGSPLLAEWFSTAAHFRIPHEHVVDLLNRAATSATSYRDELVQLTGARGRWLAAQNPQWAHLVPPDTADDAVWLHATPAARRRWFTALRAADPAAAAAVLSTAWRSEPAAHRLTFVEALSDGLGDHDEPLLESALDDRSSKVREAACRMLRRLPHSAFAQRMAQRARDWMRVDAAGLPVAALEITVPDILDESARRDGVDGVGAPGRFRDEHIRRLWTVAASAPLATWSEMAGSPAAALTLRLPDGFDEAVRLGWDAATASQRDGQWATALLHRDGTVGDRVATALPQQVLLDRLHRTDGQALLETALLEALPAPWPQDIAERVLAALYHTAPGSKLFTAVIALLSHRAPFELVDLLIDASNRTDDLERLHHFVTASDLLTQRKNFHEELS